MSGCCFGLASCEQMSTMEEQRHKVKMKKPRSLCLAFAAFVITFASLVSCDTPEADDYQQQQQQQAGGRLQAKFDASQPRVVIASRWQHQLYLPCRILDLDEEQTVSWIRKRDSLVLTIDRLRLIDDPRFALAQQEHEWTLALSEPSEQDAGLYECQVSSMEPKLSRLVELRMVEAESRILTNFSALYARPGEQVNVTCAIDAPQQTHFVYWYKNKEPIHFDDLRSSARSAKFIVRGARQTSAEEREDKLAARDSMPSEWMVRSTSSLVIKRLRLNDTANYTCLPSNAKPSHISITVIENGYQSQPEKRSLQVTDSAHSLGGLMKECWLIAKFIKLKLAETLLPGISGNRHLAHATGYDVIAIKQQQQHCEQQLSNEQHSLPEMLIKLLSSQDFQRFLITMIMTLQLR